MVVWRNGSFDKLKNVCYAVLQRHRGLLVVHVRSIASGLVDIATSSVLSQQFLRNDEICVIPPRGKLLAVVFGGAGSCVFIMGSAGLCKASQLAELFPTVSPEIVVREARLEDCWEVAETHCSSFFPRYSFPLDFLLRVNRMVGMLSGFSVPSGCHRACLVAVAGCPSNEIFLFGNEDFRIGGLDGRLSLNKGSVVGILTVDTLADFLPRKGPLRQRRNGIAYISNVAVREGFRRKGIAKRLVAKAEAQARSWGCRAVALHCDGNNPGATKLYKGQGFKCIKVPEGANWPQPKTSPDVKFNFMMKLL